MGVCFYHSKHSNLTQYLIVKDTKWNFASNSGHNCSDAKGHVFGFGVLGAIVIGCAVQSFAVVIKDVLNSEVAWQLLTHDRTPNLPQFIIIEIKLSLFVRCRFLVPLKFVIRVTVLYESESVGKDLVHCRCYSIYNNECTYSIFASSQLFLCAHPSELRDLEMDPPA